VALVSVIINTLNAQEENLTMDIATVIIFSGALPQSEFFLALALLTNKLKMSNVEKERANHMTIDHVRILAI